MAKKQTYICFDTNIYVHCALTNADSKMNTGYLRRIFKDMDKVDAKLLVPEVVFLELQKVLSKQVQLMVARLAEKQEGIEEDDLLGWKTRDAIVKAIKQSKKTLKEEADALFEELETRAKDPSLSEFIPFSDGDIVNEAIRLAIRGENPATNTEGIGLLQGDCLIAATIKHFKSNNSEARIILCSDNIHHFAKAAGEGKYVLNDCLTEYLPDIEYCRNPAELYDILLGDAESKEEIEPLKKEYERVAVAPRHEGLISHWAFTAPDYTKLFGKTDQGLIVDLSKRAQSAIGSSLLDPSIYSAISSGKDAVDRILSSPNAELSLAMANCMKGDTVYRNIPEGVFPSISEGAIYARTTQPVFSDMSYLRDVYTTPASRANTPNHDGGEEKDEKE